MEIRIREVEQMDLERLVEIEATCFPEAEAATRESLKERVKVFKHSFFVAEAEDGSMIGFINGNVTNEVVISDKMFEDTSQHMPEGAYQSIFGLDVMPAYRSQGIASRLMEYMIENARNQGRKGLILTCKERLIPYYQKFGYRNMGQSKSVHGGAVWYDMILEL